MRGWKKWHLELTLCTSQALDTAKARGLCEDNVKRFYDNLQTLYTIHNCTHLIEFGTVTSPGHRLGRMEVGQSLPE